MLKKILNQFLLLIVLSGLSASIQADDYPDDIRSAGSPVNLLNEAISYTGNVDFYAGYQEQDGIIRHLDPSGTNINYTQYRHKIEGVIDSKDDVDIIPVRIPHDYYMAFGAKVTSNPNDVVINLIPANMLYSPLENGKGIYRDYGDEKEYTDHYTGITGAPNSRYFIKDDEIYYDGRRHPSVIKTMFNDNIYYTDYVYAERGTTGGLFDFQKNRYKDDLYYYVVSLKDNGDNYRGPISYILYQDFTDIPFESPQAQTPYANTFESKDYKHTISNSNYINDDEIMIRFFRNNPDMQQNLVYPDVIGYYKPKVYFNGNYNSPKTFLDIDWRVENGFEEMVGGFERDPDASRACDNDQQNCYEVACSYSYNTLSRYSTNSYVSKYSSAASRYPNPFPKKTAEKLLSACFDPLKDAKNNGNFIRSETDKNVSEGYFNQNYRSDFDNLLGYYNKFSLSVNSFEDGIIINDTNTVITSEELAGTKDIIEIKLTSLIGDRDPYEQETYYVDVKNERSGEVERVAVIESTCEKWEELYLSEDAVSSVCFTGKLNKIKSTDFENNDNILSVLDGDTISLTVEDTYQNDLFPFYSKELKNSMEFKINEMPELARFEDMPSSKSFEEEVVLKVVDGNENKSTIEKDSIEVDVKVRNRFSNITEDFTVILEETEVNSGVFVKNIPSVIVSSESNIISDDSMFQFVGSASEYTIEYRYVDENTFFLNEGFSMENANSLHELGGIYRDNFEDENSSRDVSFKMSVLKNEDAVIDFYSANDFELNDRYTVRLEDCNLYRQVEFPEITFRNKTSGESFSIPLEQSSWNECRYSSSYFYVYEDIFKSVDLSTSNNMFANKGDEIAIEFLDPKGSNESETLITKEFMVSGIYGTNAQVMMTPEGSGRFTNISSVDNLYLMGGENTSSIVIRDTDRKLLGEAGIPLEIEIVNETKNTSYDFSLTLLPPNCSNCISNTFSSEIVFSSVENKGDVFVESDDVIVVKYLDAGRSGSSESNVLIEESFSVQNATKTNLEPVESLVLGKSNEIKVSDSDLSVWRNFLSYYEQRDYEVIKVINTRTSDSVTINMNSFYNNTSNGYLRLGKDIGQEYQKDNQLLAEVGDVLRFEFIDFLGESGVDEPIVEEFVVQEGDFDDVSVYTSDIVYQKDFSLYVEDMSANENPESIDSIEVQLFMSDGYNGEYLNEKETLTLTETGVDSGVFTLDIDPVYTNNATQEDGVVELSVWANKSVSYLKRVVFVYNQESTGQRISYENYINFEVNGVFVQLDPADEIKMKEPLEIKVFNPLTSNYRVEVNVVVTLENGESWTFRKYLEREEEGVYSDSLTVLEPPIPEGENPEDSFVCNGSSGESSVGERELSQSQFTMYEESVLCAEDGATVEVFYDYGEVFSSQINISGVIPDPIMTVKENLSVNDEALVEVVDVAGNLSSDNIDSVYGYVLHRAIDSDITDLESIADSTKLEIESFELKETGIDTGVFEAVVPMSLRNKMTPPLINNKELEVRSTLHDKEFLMFAYNGLEAYESNNDKVINPPVLVPRSLSNSLSSIEDLIQDTSVFNFEDYRSLTPFVFRDIEGGYNGELYLEKEFVDIFSTQRIRVFDMDLFKKDEDSTIVTLLNERTGDEKEVVLTLNPLTGYYTAIVEFENEDNFETQNSIKVKANDIVEVIYLDEKRENNSVEEVVSTFEILSGEDAFLDASKKIFVKDTVSILLRDTDVIGQESVAVTVKNERTEEEEVIDLTYDEINEVFVGSLDVTYGDVISELDLMGVNNDDVLTFTYIDKENSSPEPQNVTIQRTVFSGTTGVLSMPRFVYIEDGIDQNIDVFLTDFDLNKSMGVQEEIDVTIENIETGESKVITLVEDGLNSSLFFGTLSFDENFTIVDKDEIRGFYLDEITETGEPVDVEAYSEVIGGSSYSGVLTVPSEIEIGDEMSISVNDLDQNINSTERETILVSIINLRTENQESVELLETDVDTGIFTGILETSLEDVELTEGVMGVVKGDSLETEYIDDANVNGNQESMKKITLVVSGFDAEITVQDPVKVNDTISVSVKDDDENKDPSTVEEITVVVENIRTGQEILMTLSETGVDTGRFSSGLETEYSIETLEDEIMGVVAEDDLVFSYNDEMTSTGDERLLSETRTLNGGVDAVLEVVSDAFVGNEVKVTVFDEDENTLASERDIVLVNIKNERTNQEITIELEETAPNSGIFEGYFETDYSDEVSENNILSVLNEDVIFVSYEDQFNSNGGSTTLEKMVNFKAGFDGEISVTSPNEIGDAMIVTVRDRDLNVTSGVDTVLITVLNERTKESVELLLTEQVNSSDKERVRTGATNVGNAFVGMVYGVNDMVAKGNGSEIETFSGDYLVASYVDEFNSQGQSETLTAKGLFLGADAIVLDKNALEDSAIVGGLVPYTIEVENVSPNDLTNIEIVDNLPAGFRLAKDFVYVGDEKEPVSASGGVMTVTLDELDANETITLTYVLKVSSGVVEGAYENKVKPYIGSILVGNESRATVYVQDDPLFNDALVFGKVFNDVNGNGYLDNGEEGIPGVTIAGVDGINVVTDGKGRYSIEGVDGGRMDRGTNYILKVMPETLPEGSVFTTENPRVQRVTQGMPSKFNFGVKVPEQGAYTAMVEIRLGEVFFEWDKDNVKEEYASHLNRMANFIEEQGGGIIIIEGNTDSLGTDEYNEDLALRRASSVYKALKGHLSDEVFQNIEVRIIK